MPIRKSLSTQRDFVLEYNGLSFDCKKTISRIPEVRETEKSLRRKSMSEKLNRLKEILGEVSDLGRASSALGWDQQVYMPPMGAEARGQQLATLGKIAQEKFTSDEVGGLLEDLQKEYPDAETDEGAMIRVAARNYDKAKRVPSSFIAE